jgi:hypothetical protein
MSEGENKSIENNLLGKKRAGSDLNEEELGKFIINPRQVKTR